MAGSLNKVLLIGNLGRIPEVKSTPSGQTVCRFSVATTESWKDQKGEKQTKTEWHNVVVWGKQAEVAGNYLHKGSLVHVEGRIQYREYTDKAGVKKTACDIRCDNFVMLDRKPEGEGAQRQYGHPADDQDGMLPAASTSSFLDDDIPF
jgi:single-strand DNA-binding protein